MKAPIIIDTGPIVALINRNDHYHSWSKKIFKELTSPLITCEAVISEAFYLLKKSIHSENSIFELFNRDVIRIDFSLQSHHRSIQKSIKKYQSTPMDFADACLVKMAETTQGTIITLDSDFFVYRIERSKKIPLIFPD